MAGSVPLKKEQWSSQVGVILAVAGSAVGLGNFLRFPGVAAQYGGGAFMLAYFVAFLIIGLPICWAEWTLGRFGGRHGFHSSPGIFLAVSGRRSFRYLGILGVIVPVMIYMYYVYIESWCLGYAVNFALGNMNFASVEEAVRFWDDFVGFRENGGAVGFHLKQVGTFLLLVFVLNFALVYRGLSKGIEIFCMYALPALIVIALVVMVRVLTLGTPVPEKPENNVMNGLGFMWNPEKILLEERTVSPDGTVTWSKVEELVGESSVAAARAEVNADPDKRMTRITVWQQLKNPQMWLAAAGQIFFSLSVGFGVIITYASYLKETDDVVLSGLAATSTNEFCEVAIGGLSTLPVGVAFLGVAGVTGMGTFGLGFHALPMVFSMMPLGSLFGFLFFFLLFLAAATSSLSMLQPGIAYLEEAMNLNRKQSVAILGFVTAVGCGFVVFFSLEIKALDTLDFWVGTFLIFVLATVQIVLFGWGFGVDRGLEEAQRGAAIRIPSFFRIVMKYICPLFLFAIFFLWVLFNVIGYSPETGGTQVSGYVRDLFGGGANQVARMSVGLIVLTGLFFALIAAVSPRYRNAARNTRNRRARP
jgi:neurotransmitter:Na+ symporter, NSS family